MTRCASRKEVWASETPVCTLWQPSWPQAAALWAEYNDTHDPDVATTETQFSSAPSTKTPRSTQAVGPQPELFVHLFVRLVSCSHTELSGDAGHWISCRVHQILGAGAWLVGGPASSLFD